MDEDELLDAWTERTSEIMPVDDWVSLFRAHEWVGEGERPTRALRLYRGCGPGGEQGMSWTTDPQIAATYARQRAGGDGQIWLADIAPNVMLGRRAEEQEIMIDPRCIEPRRMSGQAIKFLVASIGLSRENDYFKRAPAGWWPADQIRWMGLRVRLHNGDIPRDKFADWEKNNLAPLAWDPAEHGVDDRPLTGPDCPDGSWRNELSTM